MDTLNAYYVTFGWMTSDDVLGLKGSELQVYALVHSFSQGEQGCYFGSLQHTAEMCGFSKNTAQNALKSLVEKGLLKKQKVTINGVDMCQYIARSEGIPNFGMVCKNLGEGIPNFGMGGIPNFGTNNKTTSSDNKKISKATATLDLPFSSDKFRDVWEMLCEEKEWKKKTKNALRLALKDLGKYDEEFAIELMEKTIKNGWRGVVFADTDAKYQEWKSARQHAADNQTPRTTQATARARPPQNSQIDEFYRKHMEQAEAEREAQIAALKAKYGNND